MRRSLQCLGSTPPHPAATGAAEPSAASFSLAREDRLAVLAAAVVVVAAVSTTMPHPTNAVAAECLADEVAVFASVVAAVAVAVVVVVAATVAVAVAVAAVVVVATVAAAVAVAVAAVAAQ